jgi:hypothetical protein
MVNKSSSVKQTQCCFFRRWWCAMSMTLWLWMNGGSRWDAGSSFYVLYSGHGQADSARPSRNRERHPKLAQLQRSRLLGLRPGGTSSGCCGGPCSARELVDRETLSEREGGGFGLGTGSVTKRDIRSGLSVLFWAPGHRTREVGQAEPGPPQASGYGSGPRKDEAHAGIGSVSEAFSKRNTASCTTCALPPFPRETSRD